MKIKLDEWAKMPVRAHNADAGLDLYAGEDALIMPGDYHTFDTGVHVELPSGTAGFIKSRSGMNMNRSLVCEGVIDAGYTGSIRVKLYNLGSHAQRISKEDRIAQLVIVPVFIPELEIVDDLEDTQRGGNGFGSSGR